MSDTPIFDEVEKEFRLNGKPYENLVKPVISRPPSMHNIPEPPPETVELDSMEDTAEFIVFQSAEVKPLSLRNNTEA